MDWLDLLAIQGTIKSLLQDHSSKALILWCSAFFIVQLSYPYSSVQLLSRVQLFGTTACQVFMSITNYQSLLKLMPIESVMLSNHLILCRPHLPSRSIFPSIGFFSNGLIGKWVLFTPLHIKVAKLLDFQLLHQSFQWTARTDLL